MEANSERPTAIGAASRSNSIVHDIFCWHCHGKCSAQKHDCSKCFRTFDEPCYNKLRREYPNLAACLQCVSLESSKKDFEGKEWVLDLLRHAKTAILRHSGGKFKELLNSAEWRKPKHNHAIANPMDLTKIFSKIDRNLYDTTESFIADIDCIVHNCHILFGQFGKMTKLSKELQDFSIIEEASLTDCPKCYANIYADQSESTECDFIHLLLNVKSRNIGDFWAFEQGNRSWPAKLISIREKTIRVIFFGSKRFFDTVPQNCSLYSTKNDCLSNAKYKNGDFQKALKELESYINYWKGRNVTVKSDLPYTKFDPDRFEDHRNEMFPGWNSPPTNEVSGSNVRHIDGAKKDAEKGIFADSESESEESNSEESDHSEYNSVMTDFDECESDVDSCASDVPPKRTRRSAPDHQHNEANNGINGEVSGISLETIEVSSTEGDNCPDLQRQLLNEINESAHAVKTNAQDSICVLNSTNKRKIDELNNELDNAKKAQSEWERKYNNLFAQLSAVSSERDEAIALASKYIEDIENLTESHDKMIHNMAEAHQREVKDLCDIQSLVDERFPMEQDFNAQLLEITAGMNGQAEKDQAKCKACDEPLPKSFCSSKCEGYFNKLKNMRETDESK